MATHALAVVLRRPSASGRIDRMNDDHALHNLNAKVEYLRNLISDLSLPTNLPHTNEGLMALSTMPWDWDSDERHQWLKRNWNAIATFDGPWGVLQGNITKEIVGTGRDIDLKALPREQPVTVSPTQANKVYENIKILEKSLVELNLAKLEGDHVVDAQTNQVADMILGSLSLMPWPWQSEKSRVWLKNNWSKLVSGLPTEQANFAPFLIGIVGPRHIDIPF